MYNDGRKTLAIKKPVLRLFISKLSYVRVYQVKIVIGGHIHIICNVRVQGNMVRRVCVRIKNFSVIDIFQYSRVQLIQQKCYIILKQFLTTVLTYVFFTIYFADIHNNNMKSYFIASEYTQQTLLQLIPNNVDIFRCNNFHCNSFSTRYIYLLAVVFVLITSLRRK